MQEKCNVLTLNEVSVRSYRGDRVFTGVSLRKGVGKVDLPRVSLDSRP